MKDFKWDKDKFGDNATEIEEIVKQAINFGKKSAEINANDIEKAKTDEIEKLRSEMNYLKNQAEFSKALNGVDDKNKEIILKLTDNDITKLDEVKKNYSNLFDNQPKVSLAELLNANGVSKTIEAKTDEVLAKEYENGAELQGEELNRALTFLENK